MSDVGAHMKSQRVRLVPGGRSADETTLRSRVADDATLRGRVQRIISVLTAIEAGELLADLPNCPIAQANHLAAVDLLAMAGEEAQLLAADLDLRDAG